ncbi:MAG: DUF1573 domain-containing protein [Phycisphaerales bacterium]|nr:MAG: DUF1573 domain-containing protein [Phycisphaerales bacterium]
MRHCLAGISFLILSASVASAQIPPPPDKQIADGGRKPRMHVEQPLLELGSISDGDKVPLGWLLENKGDADLFIEKVRESCGCLVTKLAETDKIIPPGGTLVLKAVFDSTRRRGDQRKYIVVHSNDPVEPMKKLEFTANVQALFELIPPSVVNLRNVQRGETAGQTLDVTPATKGDTLEVVDIKITSGSPLTITCDPFDAETGEGRRIRFAVDEFAPLGSLSTELELKIKTADVEKTRKVRVRGQVLGDLICQPLIVDETRQESRVGKQLRPVRVESPNKIPFDVLSASAGPILDVSIEPVKRALERTKYNVHLTIRGDSPPGPFGAILEVRTTSLDQPVLRVPIFGIVAEPVEVRPLLVLLRQDGTPVGTQRQIRLKAPPQQTLEILEISCENKAIVAAVDQDAPGARRHVRFINVELDGRLAKGTHETALTVKTTIEGAERLEIPVSIVVPR